MSHKLSSKAKFSVMITKDRDRRTETVLDYVTKRIGWMGPRHVNASFSPKVVYNVAFYVSYP